MITKFYSCYIIENICQYRYVYIRNLKYPNTTASKYFVISIPTFQLCVKFHAETSNLICSINQMTGFCMRWNTWLNWVKLKYEGILFFFNTSEAVTIGVLWKKVFLKIWQYPQKTVDWKHLCWGLVLIKLQVFRPATLLKRDYNTGVFLWIQSNFQECLFWRISTNGCF